jgi:hypothetical protein
MSRASSLYEPLRSAELVAAELVAAELVATELVATELIASAAPLDSTSAPLNTLGLHLM